MSYTLNNRTVRVKANDFTDLDILARVKFASNQDQKILLEFDPPLIIANTVYNCAVIAPRLARDSINTLLNEGLLGCTVTWIPVARFNPDRPFDVSWWLRLFKGEGVRIRLGMSRR